MSEICSTPPEQVVTILIGTLLKKEGGGYLNRKFFGRGEKYCLVEEVTRIEDCGCMSKPESERKKTVVYYRFKVGEDTYLINSSLAAIGVAQDVTNTEAEFIDRIGSAGDPLPNVNKRNDAEIRRNWGKVRM